MRRPLYYIQKHVCRLLAMMACSTCITSCDNILDNGYGDCEVVEEYRIKFKYDYNMKYADAFAQEVRSVTLYAFGEDGRLAYQKTEEGDLLADKDYTMLVEMQPGNYDLIAWAGLEDQTSFAVPVLTAGVSTMEDLTCRMNRIARSRSVEQMDSVGYLKPLWHGQVEAALASRATVNTHIVEVPLVKNTNTLRVILQQLSDKTVNVDDYKFVITDDNGLMNYDNSLMEDDSLAYYPYFTAQGSAAISRDAEDSEALNVAVAELSIGRLVESQNPRLTITKRADNDTVLSIPLIDYFELCKMVAHYDMPVQEYLDREDEYNMTFFLDQSNRWVNTQIIINDWIVRYNDITPDFK